MQSTTWITVLSTVVALAYISRTLSSNGGISMSQTNSRSLSSSSESTAFDLGASAVFGWIEASAILLLSEGSVYSATAALNSGSALGMSFVVASCFSPISIIDNLKQLKFDRTSTVF